MRTTWAIATGKGVRIMNIFLALRVCLPVSLLLLGSPSVQADTITLFGSDNLPPKAWQDGRTPRGYAVDAAIEALNRAGYQVEVKLEPWTRAIEDTKAGNGIITHFSKTPQRERSFEFSEPLVYDRIVVVVRKGHEFPFTSVQDLAGKTVGVLRGVAYGGEWSDALKTFTAEEDTDAVARIGKLVRGRLDAAVISSGTPGLEIAVREAGLEMAQFTILPVPVLEDPNYLAIAKGTGSERKMAAINAAIAQMRGDGAIDRIMAKYADPSWTDAVEAANGRRIRD
jgi:ABC-type amino acid transport substrate-binding protein